MKIKLLLYILLGLFVPLQVVNGQVSTQKVRIGIIMDGTPEDYAPELTTLREELDLILGAVYDVQLPEAYVLGCERSPQKIAANYERLLQAPEIEMIIVFGVLSSSLIGQEKSFPKPVILYGVENPVLQGISEMFRHTSGVDNLTYIVTNESFERDLFVYHQLYPFNDLGVILSSEMLEVLPFESALLDTLQREQDFEITILPAQDSLQTLLDTLPESIDALYIGYHSQVFADKELKALFQEMKERRIPVFTSNSKHVELGALASNTPEPNLPKVMRRIVLDIESILEGVNPSQLPIVLSVEEQLKINVQVLRQLDFAPSYEMLSQAELVNQFEYDTDRQLSLVDVLLEVQQSNIELRAARKRVESSFQDVNIEKAGFYPFARLVASQAWIDDDQVEFEGEGNSEFVTTAIMSVEQLLFSEQVMGNYVVQQHLYDAEGYDYLNRKLDLILEAGESYFEILRRQNALKVARDNLKLTQENLDLAAAREEVGYSSASDVYRWEANRAQATSTVIQQQTELELSKIRLNLLLNRPYTELFSVKESGLTDSLVNVYFDNRLQRFLYDPKSLSFFSDFLVQEGIRNSPTIKAIDELLSAQQRFLRQNRRKRYIPELSLVGDFFFTLLRGGTGTEGIIVPGPSPITVDPEFPPTFTYVFSVNATLPFLQGGRIKYLSQQAMIEIERLEEERRLEIVRIQENVSESLLNATVNAFNLELRQRAARFAQRAYVMVKTSYSNGQSLFVDLLQAQNEAILARLDAANAVYDYLISLLRVDRAISSYAILRSEAEEGAFQRRFENYFDKLP